MFSQSLMVVLASGRLDQCAYLRTSAIGGLVVAHKIYAQKLACPTPYIFLHQALCAHSLHSKLRGSVVSLMCFHMLVVSNCLAQGSLALIHALHRLSPINKIGAQKAKSECVKIRPRCLLILEHDDYNREESNTIRTGHLN